MDSARWIVDLLTSPATPAWGVFLIVAVFAWRASVAGFPAIILSLVERSKAKAAAKEADWTRLRDERNTAVQSRDAWMLRAIAAEGQQARLEAIDLGQGEVRNQQATEAAYERLIAENERLRKLLVDKNGKHDG